MTDQDPTTPDLITTDELTALFGPMLPMDAVHLLERKDLSVSELRAELKALAARPSATPGGEREAIRAILDQTFIAGLRDSTDEPPCLTALMDEDEESAFIDAILAALSRPAPVAGEAVGVAETEVGRAVYERLATLSERNPDRQTSEWVEMGYLDDLTTSVEELGAFDGPHRPLSPAPQPAAARGGEREQIAKCIIGPRLPVPSTSPFSLSELRDVRWDSARTEDKADALCAADAILSALSAKGGS